MGPDSGLEPICSTVCSAMAREGNKRLRDGNAGEQLAAKRRELAANAEVVFRLLIPSRKAGSILGKSGTIVREIKSKTNSRVKVIESVPGCEERVVVISSKDFAEQEKCPAQLALFEVHKRLIETEEQVLPGERLGGNYTVRLLVSQSQAATLIGKSGKNVQELRQTCGAQVKILGPEELPTCALYNDRVVQLSGALSQLDQALHRVSKHIREHPPHERPGGLPPTLVLPSTVSSFPSRQPPSLASTAFPNSAETHNFQLSLPPATGFQQPLSTMRGGGGYY